MTRVLLVEDHEELRDLLARRLSRRGFEVLLAPDGQRGVEMARSERPDVILLDMNLPVMDGWTAARTLRGEDTTANIPIIALTAHAMAGDRARMLEAGCHDYHPKPVDFARLLEQIDEILLARDDEG
ncbi:MAG TPA: response regulator [Acetobacteraceae bacterium]|nr:response regulator [Acetobacteraceae bacterium]